MTGAEGRGRGDGAAGAGVVVLLNASAGGGRAERLEEELERLLDASGEAAAVELVRASGPELAAAARRAVRAGCRRLVVGGGDGTVSSVAAVAVESGVPLGVLPAGTLNHFAKDLGLPLDLEPAVRVALRGVARPVDVAEVNGRLFLNNSSLGVYPRIVRERERHWQGGRGKWLAALWATLVVLRRHPFMAVRVTADGEAVVRRTPFVLVGNNEYRMEGLQAAARESLTDGRLALYMMNASGRRSLLWLGWQVLRGRTREIRELDLLTAEEAVIETRRRRLQVALDGEVAVLESPLRYRIRPAALAVMAPPADETG